VHGVNFSVLIKCCFSVFVAMLLPILVILQSVSHWPHEMIAILLDPSTTHSVFRAGTSESRETLSMAVAATTCGPGYKAWFAHHHLVW